LRYSSYYDILLFIPRESIPTNKYTRAAKYLLGGKIEEEVERTE